MIKAEIGSNKNLESISPDGLTIFLLGEGKFRGALLNGTLMLNEMQANHELGPLESLVLGHAYLGVGLLVNNLKGNDRIGFSIECGGPVGGLSVEADYFGNVRGFLSENPIPLKEPLESLNTSLLFGPGFMKVTKSVEGASQPFTGQVMLEYGNIGQDLAHYYLTSEQIATSFSLSMDFDRDGGIIGAGGLFLQALPGTSDEEAGVLEDQILKLPSLGKLISSGKNVNDMINEFFSDFSPMILEKKDIQFFCPCTKDRIASFIASLDGKEKQSILADGPFPLKTRCHNCGTMYEFEESELRELFS